MNEDSAPGLVDDHRTMDGKSKQTTATESHWLAWALLLLVTVAAIFIYLYRLGDLRPVPYFDPAFNGMDALRVIRRGTTPFFFPANGGREPLFLYLQALAIGALGVNSFALRLPGALAGALTVPLIFGFARIVLADEEKPLSSWVPAWASLALALSVWTVSQTREGLRASVLPLFSVGILWLFVVGWRRGSLLHLAAAGALLGLSAYTYTAFRFLPFVLALAALPDLLTKREPTTISRSQRWRGFGILILAAALVFAPLGWFYLRYPITFDERAASVMIWNVLEPGPGSTIVEEMALSLWRTLFWFLRWPIPLAVGLIAGLAFALARLRQFEYRLLPIWWLVMLLPTILTIETPHLLRSLGAAPPAYLLIGLGLAAIAIRLTRCWQAPSGVILVVGLLIIALSSLPALWRYFHPTTPDPRAGTQALANTLTARAETEVVYFPLSAYADPSLRFLLASQFERKADWLVSPAESPARLIQPIESPDSPAVIRLSPDGWITLLPPLRPDGRKILHKAVPSDQPITDQYGALVGYEVTLPTETDPARYLMQAEVSTDAAITGVADLVGYSLDAPEISDAIFDLLPGNSFWITTFWRARGGASKDYDLVIRLIDDAGRQWAQSDGPPLEGAYPTSLWRSGEKVADARLLWVDPNAPPGRYRLAVAFFDNLTESRLPVSGSSVPDTIYLGPFKVPLPPPIESLEGVQPQSARFGDVAQLLGYGLTSQLNEVSLSLYWKAELPDSVDYTIFVHLLDETGRLVLGHDDQPMSGSYPTGIWEPGEIILDEHTFDTSGLPPGEYQVEVGMYLLDTGERLPIYLPDGKENVAYQLILTTPVKMQ